MQLARQYEDTIRVMLIDDHNLILWGLKQLIESGAPRMAVAGTASSCAEALAQVASVAPNVILLDVDLAGESGVDLIPRLLTQTNAQVLVLTGCRDTALLDLAIIHGARGVVRKDAPAEQLMKAIEKVHQGEMWLDREALGRVLGGMMNPQSTAASRSNASLTARERKIICLFVKCGGVLNKDLAQQLFISEHTLRNHLTSIYQKLGVNNRLELYVYARKHRLDQTDDAEAGSMRDPASLTAANTWPASRRTSVN